MAPTTTTTTPDLAAVLRLEVGRFRLQESRRRFDQAVHLGRIGGCRETFVVQRGDAPVMDAGLRAEVVRRLLERFVAADSAASAATVWLTRPGVASLHDDDLSWYAAARAAFASHGHRLDGFYALTRTGWLDVLSGESRTWRRLRL
jgi:hypothetical protein